MKYTAEERLEIGRQVYTEEISEAEAEIKYAVGRTSIQNYVRLYKRSNGINIKRRKPATSDTPVYSPPETALSAYEAMSKDELINELIKAKANEARAKKGYEVKGVGASKEYISLSSKNSK